MDQNDKNKKEHTQLNESGLVQSFQVCTCIIDVYVLYIIYIYIYIYTHFKKLTFFEYLTAQNINHHLSLGSSDGSCYFLGVVCGCNYAWYLAYYDQMVHVSTSIIQVCCGFWKFEFRGLGTKWFNFRVGPSILFSGHPSKLETVPRWWREDDSTSFPSLG